MDVSTISGTNAAEAAEAATPQGTVQTKQNELGMDEFFKLLTTQLTSQDPLKPMDDTEFISQMASFSSLSQMEIIAENTEASRKQQQTASVMSLIGKDVEAEDVDGEKLVGRIDRVESIDGELVPFIGSNQVPFLKITRITDPLMGAAAPTAPTPADGSGG
ncbi:MAG: flagellar hook capping FlgD N-terminal domain-containing protein [Opitutales bacterium]